MNGDSSLPDLTNRDTTGQIPKRSHSFGSQVMLTTATNVALGVIGLGTGVLAARILGVQGRGLLAAIQTWPLCIALVALVGLPDGLIFYSAKDRLNSGRYLISALAFVCLVSGIFIAIGYSLLPTLLQKQPTSVHDAARMFLIVIPLSAAVVLPLSALRSINETLVWNILRLVPVLGWAVVLGLAWYFGHSDAVYLAKAYLVLLSVVVILVLTVTITKIGGPFRPSFSKVKKMLRFGLPSLATSLPLVLNMRLDQLCIAGFLSPRALGLYVVGVAWGSMANPLLYGLGTILFPRIAAIADEAGRSDALTSGSRLAVLVSLFFILVLALPAIVMVPLLFGEQFRSAEAHWHAFSRWVLLQQALILSWKKDCEDGVSQSS